MDKAAARPEPELQLEVANLELHILEAVNRCGHDTMCATINVIDAMTTDEETALLEASATGRGADHATPIAERDGPGGGQGRKACTGLRPEREHVDVMPTPPSTTDKEAAARGVPDDADHFWALEDPWWVAD